MGAIDMTMAAKAPPARQSRSAASGGTRTTVKDRRIEALDGTFQLAQMGCVFFKQYADAGAIGMYGHDIAVEVAGLASTDERIAKAIDYLMEAGPYAGLITAVMPFAMQLLVNHKILPEGRIQGTLPPDVLQAKTEAAIIARSAQAMREAQEARQEAAQMLEDAMRWEAEDAAERAAQNGAGSQAATP